MTEESLYFKEGDVIMVKDCYRLNLYDLSDPIRQYYEEDFVYGPSLMIVLDIIKGTRNDIDKKHRETISYKVFTDKGVGHIIAYTKDYKYSYYEFII
jgi:hypothetical protein